MSKKEKIFPLSTLGGRIQHQRKDILRISRPELYDLIRPNENVSSDSKSRTIKNWESGQNEPDYDTLIKLCKELNCSSDYLLGLEECTNKHSQFIHEYTGISESAINRLHKFTTYNQGMVRLAIIDYLLCDTDFTVVLADRINSYYTKYDFFESGKKRYFEESKTLHNLAGDDIIKQIELQESGEFTSTISRHKLAERESSKDAAKFRVQKEFDDILDDLTEHFYKINNPEDKVTK